MTTPLMRREKKLLRLRGFIEARRGGKMLLKKLQPLHFKARKKHVRRLTNSWLRLASIKKEQEQEHEEGDGDDNT